MCKNSKIHIINPLFNRTPRHSIWQKYGNVKSPRKRELHPACLCVCCVSTPWHLTPRTSSRLRQLEMAAARRRNLGGRRRCSRDVKTPHCLSSLPQWFTTHLPACQLTLKHTDWQTVTSRHKSRAPGPGPDIGSFVSRRRRPSFWLNCGHVVVRQSASNSSVLRPPQHVTGTWKLDLFLERAWPTSRKY